jgi:mannonate dehydratase
MLNRRQIMRSTPTVAVGGTLAAAGSMTPASVLAQTSAPMTPNRKPVLMKAGANVNVVDDRTMKAVARWGIRNCYAFAAISDPDRLYPTVDELKTMQDIAQRNGVNVDILRPLNLTMSNIDDEKYPAIMLGQSPQRDRDIEGFQNTIKNCAEAGISGMRYTLSIVGNTRSRTAPGRGDATYVGSRMSDYSGPPRSANRTVPTAADQPAGDGGQRRRGGGPNSGLINKPITKAGRITADTYWERITYFLDRVVPVANQYKIKLASHMEDAMVPLGYEGVDLVTNTVEGAKKFVSIQDSPYHGLLFCIGTFSEMLQNPSRDIYDVVQWFGANKKIHLVDFRNIRGNRQDFVETFPDEGEIDLLRVMQILRDTGYEGMVVPDHEPQTPGGPEQVDAFQYGYIRGLLQAVGRLE